MCNPLTHSRDESRWCFRHSPCVPHPLHHCLLACTAVAAAATSRHLRHITGSLLYPKRGRRAGAGLGGGSANAATTLWAANEAAGRPASDAQLLAWAADIGSDISVFFSQGAAYCTGR